MALLVVALLAVPLPALHRQRTPRSLANEPRLTPLEPSAVGAGSAVGAVAAASLERSWQRTPLGSTASTSHGRPPTSIAIFVGSEPKPVPATDSSVPPASEPTLGWMLVMRGGSSAWNGVPCASHTVEESEQGAAVGGRDEVSCGLA